MKYPEKERILIVRPCLKTVCLGIRPAAKLLSLLLFYARECDDQQTEFTFSCTQSELVADLIEEMDVKTLQRTAVPMLRLLGFIEVDGSSYRYYYTVHLDLIQNAINHHKNKEQLDKILIVSMNQQLEKCRNEIDNCPIELDKILIELEKCLIPFRQITNSKRGRKPRTKDALEGVSESLDNNITQIDSDITDSLGVSAHASTPHSQFKSPLPVATEDTKDDDLQTEQGEDHDTQPEGQHEGRGSFPESMAMGNPPQAQQQESEATRHAPHRDHPVDLPEHHHTHHSSDVQSGSTTSADTRREATERGGGADGIAAQQTPPPAEVPPDERSASGIQQVTRPGSNSRPSLTPGQRSGKSDGSTLTVPDAVQVEQEVKEKPKRNRKPPTPKPEPSTLEDQLSEDEMALYREWCSLFHVEVPLTKAIVQASKQLTVPCTTWARLWEKPRVGILKDIKDYVYTNDRNGYYKGRGVKLYDCSRELEGWLDVQEKQFEEKRRRDARALHLQSNGHQKPTEAPQQPLPVLAPIRTIAGRR